MTSFRYPHFHIGRQPSYPMPPPATIYGHICSAVGEWISRDALQFAYNFTSDGRGDDLELLHITSIGSRQIKRGWDHPRNIEVQPDPRPRELLFRPKLTLYLNPADNIYYWLQSFRSPAYPVLLGRSQDLAGYSTVEMIELVQSDYGYFQNTILPWSMRDRLPDGITFHMPKFINPANRTQVSWARYIVLEDKMWWPGQNIQPPKESRKALRQQHDGPVWIDPLSMLWGEGHRIVVWHAWI